MKTPRIYVDTSVLGGCFDPEFATWSNRLMRDFELGVSRAVFSPIVEEEVENAPRHVREKYLDLLAAGAELIELTPESRALADHYAAKGILGPRYANDLRHIALASVANVDVLVSWNFKHIVHYDKIRLFNAANLELGYKTLQILSPREVASNE